MTSYTIVTSAMSPTGDRERITFSVPTQGGYVVFTDERIRRCV